MFHKLYEVIDYELMDAYSINVTFNDGKSQTIDFRPVLYGEMWGPLQELTLFRQVEIDPIARTLTWPNGADFDPETLHNWDEYEKSLSERAQAWDMVLAV